MGKLFLFLIFVLIFPARVHAQNFSVSTIETDMLELLNQIRADYSLPPLEQNWEATRVAKYKSEEMKNLEYAAHDSPVYGNPADMLKHYEIPFEIVGENIAAGPLGINGAVYEWLEVPVYRENILYDGYKEVGIGHSRDNASGDSYWVLLFIS